METEVRLVYWKDKKVTDIIAKTVEDLPEKRSPRIVRAFESLVRFHERRKFTDYDKVTVEIVQFEKQLDGHFQRGNSITLPY